MKPRLGSACHHHPEAVCCRGFCDAHGDRYAPIQLARRLDAAGIFEIGIRDDTQALYDAAPYAADRAETSREAAGTDAKYTRTSSSTRTGRSATRRRWTMSCTASGRRRSAPTTA